VKEAASNNDITECYKKIPKSEVLSELNEVSVTKWQSDWDLTTKGAIMKSFFPNIEERLKQKIDVTPNFTTLVTGHGNIKAYLHKYKIQESPICSCKRGEQTVDHVLYDCELLEEETDRLKAAVMRTDSWPVSKTLTNTL
jgi:hypothetical protein